jgi:hypothetical protein
MLRWGRYRFHKKHTGSHYTYLFFLHSVGSASHVVHSSGFGKQKLDTVFFMLRWDRYRFIKKCARTHYAKLVFLHPVGSVGHVLHSGASGDRNGEALFFMVRRGLIWIQQKTCSDTLC